MQLMDLVMLIERSFLDVTAYFLSGILIIVAILQDTQNPFFSKI